MAEYISREAVIERLEKLFKLQASTARAIIEAIPAADVVERKRGEWIEDEYAYIHCSKCGMEWDEPEHQKTNYCPNCGARMDGGADD